MEAEPGVLRRVQGHVGTAEVDGPPHAHVREQRFNQQLSGDQGSGPSQPDQHERRGRRRARGGSAPPQGTVPEDEAGEEEPAAVGGEAVAAQALQDKQLQAQKPTNRGALTFWRRQRETCQDTERN